MDSRTGPQTEFLNRTYEYCEWLSQKSFTYPNWEDSREDFLNLYWKSFLTYAVSSLGNPLLINQNDLHQVILAYQDPSYLNSLKRIYTTLLSQEYAENEKIIWTGLIEDPGVKPIKSMGVEGRKSSTHYMIFTHRSLILKSSDKSLTQKWPINSLELDPHGNGFRITQAAFDLENDFRIEIFSSQGTINGQEVKVGIRSIDSGEITRNYTENYLKMVAAFALAREFQEIKLQLIEDGFYLEMLDIEQDEDFLSMIWSYLVEVWGYGANMIDQNLEILHSISRNQNLNSSCIDQIITFQVQYAKESSRNNVELAEWLHSLLNRANLNEEQKKMLDASLSAIRDRNQGS
jgi:hypothetical protein